MADADPKVALLAAVPMFANCRDKDLRQIAQLVDEVDLPDGKVLMREGETGAEMFLISSGAARVERGGQVVGEFGPGSVLGEMALVSEGPRNATVTAVGPVRALVVGHREFHSLMDDHPKFRMKVFEGLARKIRRIEEDAVH
jgi:CRP/FNR family transcriptional regulator, cyclic AMP receptor protein